MGIIIKIRKRDKKFRAYSTTVDEYYHEGWWTREQMTAFLKQRVMKDARNKCKDIENTFPNGYYSDYIKRIWFDNPKELSDKKK